MSHPAADLNPTVPLTKLPLRMMLPSMRASHAKAKARNKKVAAKKAAKDERRDAKRFSQASGIEAGRPLRLDRPAAAGIEVEETGNYLEGGKIRERLAPGEGTPDRGLHSAVSRGFAQSAADRQKHGTRSPSPLQEEAMDPDCRTDLLGPAGHHATLAEVVSATSTSERRSPLEGHSPWETRTRRAILAPLTSWVTEVRRRERHSRACKRRKRKN